MKDDDRARYEIIDRYTEELYLLAVSNLLIRSCKFEVLDMGRRTLRRVFDEFWEGRHDLDDSIELKEVLVSLTLKIIDETFGEE